MIEPNRRWCQSQTETMETSEGHHRNVNVLEIAEWVTRCITTMRKESNPADPSEVRYACAFQCHNVLSLSLSLSVGRLNIIDHIFQSIACKTLSCSVVLCRKRSALASGTAIWCLSLSASLSPWVDGWSLGTRTRCLTEGQGPWLALPHSGCKNVGIIDAEISIWNEMLGDNISTVLNSLLLSQHSQPNRQKLQSYGYGENMRKPWICPSQV